MPKGIAFVLSLHSCLLKWALAFWCLLGQILNKRKEDIIEDEVPEPVLEARLVTAHSGQRNEVLRLVLIHSGKLSAGLMMRGSKLALSPLMVNEINGMRAQDSQNTREHQYHVVHQ